MNREGEEQARLSWQLDLYRSALNLISNFGGKTLISMSYGQAYSLGANAAFEQCADIAKDALTKGEEDTP